MKIALIQMSVGYDKAENVARACDFVTRAAQQGADLVVLPEMFNCPYSGIYFREYAEPLGGKTWQALSAAARKNNVLLIGGSFPELYGDALYNTSFVFDSEGDQLARHRKMHLFDIDIEGGQRFCESDSFSAGDEVTVFDTPFGRIGLCICFDMRFPELSRLMAMSGAQAVVVPAAFNMTTGPMHWELMFRQRAVDNQLFTVGVSPARDEHGPYVAYGNSIVASPWGKVLYRMDETETLALCDLDFEENQRARAQLPLLPAIRKDVYELTLI